jgi:curved DNA-binding protein CbpA
VKAFKSYRFAGGHAEQLKVFCQQVMKTRLTPDLITLVASEIVYIHYCREIANADAQHRKRFASFCRENGFDPDEIRTRACLAATALGMCKQADYYGILGVSSDADNTAIKQAYRKKAQILHPDKFNGDERNNEAFIELHTAYVHLKDSGLRKAYDETRQCIGYWIEGEKVPTLSKRRSGVGRFIGWTCVMLGGMLVVAYAFDVFQNKSSFFSFQQSSEAWLEESGPTFVATLTSKTATGETVKPMADQGNVSRAEADDGVPSKAAPASLPKAKSATFSTDIKKGSTERTIEATEVSRLKKATSVKAAKQMVKKKHPPLRNDRMVPEIAKVAVPKKVARPVSGAILPDGSTVSEARKSYVAQTAAVEKKIDAKTFYLLQKLRVLSFLQNYTKTYEEKDLEKFRTFFAANALEQGRPFETLLTKYQRTFDSVEALQYEIELKSVSMDKGSNKIYVEGNFTTRYQLPEDDWGSCIGLIRMELLDEPEGLLVSRLDYNLQ